MIITISGMPGSGKTTIGKLLAKKLKYKFYSVGHILRALAIKKKINFDSFTKEFKTTTKYDKEVDDFQIKLGQTKDNFVIEGRTGFYFIPHSKKVFLTVDINVAAERIFKQSRKEQKFKNVKEALKETKRRMVEDRKRYKKLYNIDYLDECNYDVIVDTTQLKPEEIVKDILTKIK